MRTRGGRAVLRARRATRPQAPLRLIWRVRDRATLRGPRAGPPAAGRSCLAALRPRRLRRPAAGGLRRRAGRFGTAVERNRARRRLRAAVAGMSDDARARAAPTSSAPDRGAVDDPLRRRSRRRATSWCAPTARSPGDDGGRRRAAIGPGLALLMAADPGWRLISVHLPPRCRFHPSCSQYALEALDAARRRAAAPGSRSAGSGAATRGTTAGSTPSPTEHTFALTSSRRSARRKRADPMMILADAARSSTRSTTSSGRSSRSSTGIIPNLGVAIILLTFVVMLLLFPLTAKQAKSMMAMQRAQPEIKKLQAKYKGDRQKLNEEMMKFYQENKINPLAGCLPLLVQMPIFIALFQVMREAVQAHPEGADLYAAFCTDAKGSAVTPDAVRRAKARLPNPQHFLGMDLSQTRPASPAGSSTRSPTSSSSGS